jgi:hypothetical protein
MEVEVLPLLLADIPLHRGLEPYSQVEQLVNNSYSSGMDCHTRNFEFLISALNRKSRLFLLNNSQLFSSSLFSWKCVNMSDLNVNFSLDTVTITYKFRKQIQYNMRKY